MSDYSTRDKKPDYMDGFTGLKSDRYSDLKMHYELSFADSCGKVYAGDAFKVPAATKGTWIISITNEGKSIKKGGQLSLYLYNGSFAPEIQTTNSKGKNYMSMEYSGNADIKLSEKTPGFGKVCHLYIVKGAFKKGEIIILKIGDMKNGGSGSNTYWTAGKSYLFIEACVLGDEALPIERSPFTFEIIARDDRAFIRLLGPTIAKKGQPQRIHIGVFDKCGNLMNNFAKTVLVEKKEYEMQGGLGLLEGVIFNKEGVYRLKATVKGEKREYYSNPIIVKNNPSHYIYWGDLHAHGWGDATMHLMHVNNEKTSPLARHIQARDIGRFDFCAPGPMSFPRVDRIKIWDEYKDACRQIDEPGKYIPFLAYEAHPLPEGDRNIFFKSLKENLPPDYRMPMNELEEKYGKRNDVFLEVHIGGRIPRWGDYKPERERMVEVVSAFGNAEWLLQEALDKGYKPAVCGCSDLHYGLMGGPRTVEEARGRFGKYLNSRDSAYGTGPVTAVKASSLDRENLWEAFEQRHTYATTDQRIYIDFEVDGVSYGDERNENEVYKVKIECHGTDVIQSVEIVSGKYIVKRYNPDKLDFSVEILLNSSELKGDFIYMKVMQRDGGFAICSPVYINIGQPAWDSGSIYSYNEKEAEKYKRAVIKYLLTEENIALFGELKPIGIIDEKITKCALFHCKFGSRDISIRWYFDYEVPRIRIDWEHVNIGVKNDEMIYKL